MWRVFDQTLPRAKGWRRKTWRLWPGEPAPPWVWTMAFWRIYSDILVLVWTFFGFLVFYRNPRSLIFSLKFKDFKKTLNLRLLPGSGWLKLSMYHFKARHSWGSMESWVEKFSLHWRLVTIFSQFSNKNALKWCLNSRHFRLKWSYFDSRYMLRLVWVWNKFPETEIKLGFAFGLLSFVRTFNDLTIFCGCFYRKIMSLTFTQTCHLRHI